MVRPESNSEAFGIDNGQSWSAQLPDGSSGARVMELLPLPPNIQTQVAFFLFTNIFVVNIRLLFKGIFFFAGAKHEYCKKG
jgi:hypothetical protein